MSDLGFKIFSGFHLVYAASSSLRNFAKKKSLHNRNVCSSKPLFDGFWGFEFYNYSVSLEILFFAASSFKSGKCKLK